MSSNPASQAQSLLRNMRVRLAARACPSLTWLLPLRTLAHSARLAGAPLVQRLAVCCAELR